MTSSQWTADRKTNSIKDWAQSSEQWNTKSGIVEIKYYTGDREYEIGAKCSVYIALN